MAIEIPNTTKLLVDTCVWDTRPNVGVIGAISRVVTLLQTALALHIFHEDLLIGAQIIHLFIFVLLPNFVLAELATKSLLFCLTATPPHLAAELRMMSAA